MHLQRKIRPFYYSFVLLPFFLPSFFFLYSSSSSVLFCSRSNRTLLVIQTSPTDGLIISQHGIRANHRLNRWSGKESPTHSQHPQSPPKTLASLRRTANESTFPKNQTHKKKKRENR
eukprot:TRINITY_DN8211_c1_g1_i4.p1 TRINITY_DN8211_c1_g1~~TRINITY_DN8211_c1_g1_i4.p1  ORF type:complete len:117 (-),score=7.38 TRINITY_DN8211_c1_g1_i4:410-760(-)